MYIDALWVGNILAPYSTVIMGQSNKNIFGSIVAKNILIHQYSKIIGLEFQDKTSAIIVKQME